MERIRMGILVQDTLPVPPAPDPAAWSDIPEYKPDSLLTFRDAPEGSELALGWYPSGENLVCERVLLTAISWADLDRQGFVRGRLVRLGGREWLCRLPVLQDWMVRLSALRLDTGPERWPNAVWHWSRAYTIFQETVPHDDGGFPPSDSIPASGFTEPCYPIRLGREQRDFQAGFRPVLEPLVRPGATRP